METAGDRLIKAGVPLTAEWCDCDFGNLSWYVSNPGNHGLMSCYVDKMLRSATNFNRTIGSFGLEIFLGPKSTISTLPHP